MNVWMREMEIGNVNGEYGNEGWMRMKLKLTEYDEFDLFPRFVRTDIM